MKIRKLAPTAFGKFLGPRTIELSGGLNIIRGNNEAGKSTLGAFILGMFYGFKKEGRTRISRDLEYERYRPWTGSDYRGTLVYEEGGRIYRVERSFDPDLVRIYDDTTGEDVTRLFSQDSRKEYDFARKHLGLTAKEFRNTVWIGQLGSPQEPGLGAEIQGKLGDILQGGSQDVSLVRALSALSDERAKIKAPRSQKAKLDIVQQEIAELSRELKSANERAEELRGWLIEASNLSREKERLEEAVSRGEWELAWLRRGMLKGLLAEAEELQGLISDSMARLEELRWAKDVPQGAGEEYRALKQEIDAVARRREEAEGELARLEQKAKEIEAKLSASMPSAESVDEAALMSLYSRYSSAKATAFKSERSANDARKELRTAEEEGRLKGYPDEEFNKEILKEAEELQETVHLAEKAKAKMEVEVERARSQVVSRKATGSPGVLYALALATLGIAVALTVMAMPMSWSAFGVALALLAAGVYRQSAAAKLRREDETVLAQKEREVEEQVERIESARKALQEYLAVLGAKSVEELRAVARDLDLYRARLKNARERYEAAHKFWFEASQEFAAIEKELVEILKSLGCLEGGEAITDAVVNLGRQKLAKHASLKRDLVTLNERMGETRDLLSELDERLSRLKTKETEVFAACGVQSSAELEKKLVAKREHDEAERTLSEYRGRLGAFLLGRDPAEILEEVARLDAELAVSPWQATEGEAVYEETVSESDYEARRRAQDAVKARLGEVKTRLAALENGIRLRMEDTRPVFEIEEELARKRAVEEELAVDWEALDLAYNTLSELSKSLRREFAPELNRRVGEIMKRITSGRYRDIRISPDLEISVVHPETGSQVDVSSLSGGTVDQCYFALRVAIAEAITKKDEIPFFLDDSFVQYDDTRLAGALEILASLAKRHQILLFSCHGREEDVARRLGIPFRRIEL
ncbi:MAG TPA: AAA family ATPase [Firmicutes bacterium]|nr:AAA family ATPase [Candidatus Fermentithermobacillaceae bacterium]